MTRFKDSRKKKNSHKGTQIFRLMAIVVFCGLAFCKSMGQDKVELDVNKLIGSDPADIINTDNTHRVTPNSEEARSMTFLLFNVGTQEFMNIGGSYGRHASLSTAGMYLWIFNNSNTKGAYNIRTLQNYQDSNKDNKDSYVQFVDNDALKNGVYLDQQPTDNSRNFGWKFEQADGYNATTNKVYKISTYGNRYLTAIPDDPDGNLCEATTDSPEKSEYQTWKLITVKEYYDLFYKSPSDLSSPIDATFLLKNPDFQYSTTNSAHWAATGGHSDAVRYGIEGFYKHKGADTSYQGDKVNNKEYLCENGKYFCADINNCHNIIVDQMITVNKPGWYIFRCNGFSNTNELAKIFVTTYFDYEYDNKKILASNPLNPLEPNGPKNLLEAGKAFYDGKYENQVMLHLTQDDLDSCKGTLMFGIEVDGDSSSPTNEWTAFDNFRMLYAGDTDTPNLVLDEDNPDLRYLTETNYEYKNTILHLHRTFTLNKWNTLILPVNLTYGQMKRTFGDEVCLAELMKLTAHSVQFRSVECQHDDDIMLKAYTPYIIKPTKEAGENSSYTTPRLLKADNQYWLGENEGITYPEEGVTRYRGGKVTINGSHYDISGITLDKTALTSNLNSHWESTITQYTDGKDMVCKGTMAKTYYAKNNKGYFYMDDNESRDNLAGAYFMKYGEMWKVPEDKSYGMKAFRCWFRLTDQTDSQLNKTDKAKEVKLYLNGVEMEDNSTTGIDDIDFDDSFGFSSNYKPTSHAVYNLNGQMVRQGLSIEGLSAGIYIVGGRKVMVK